MNFAKRGLLCLGIIPFLASASSLAPTLAWQLKLNGSPYIREATPDASGNLFLNYYDSVTRRFHIARIGPAKSIDFDLMPPLPPETATPSPTDPVARWFLRR